MSTVKAKIYLKGLISNLEDSIIPYQSIINQCKKALNELEEGGEQ